MEREKDSRGSAPFQTMNRGVYKEGSVVAFNFNPLFKLLIDRNLKQKDLCKMSGVSHATLTRLRRGENVKFDVLARICAALNCDVSAITVIYREDGAENVRAQI